MEALGRVDRGRWGAAQSVDSNLGTVIQTPPPEQAKGPFQKRARARAFF